MLNLFRAQWYRLVRNRAFWGLLAVFGVLVFLFVIQVDEQSVREGVYRNFPALGGAPEGVGVTMDVEAVLGQFWVPSCCWLLWACCLRPFSGTTLDMRACVRLM